MSRRLTISFAVIVASALPLLPASADEPIALRVKGKQSPQLGQTNPEAAPRPLTIRRPAGTFLCPDPRDLGRHCPIVQAHSQIRLGPGAPNALLRESWLMPPQMPPIDYNQAAMPGLYHVTSSIDQLTGGFDARMPAYLLLRGRTMPAPSVIPLPSLMLTR